MVLHNGRLDEATNLLRERDVDDGKSARKQALCGRVDVGLKGVAFFSLCRRLPTAGHRSSGRSEKFGGMLGLDTNRRGIPPTDDPWNVVFDSSPLHGSIPMAGCYFEVNSYTSNLDVSGFFLSRGNLFNESFKMFTRYMISPQ